MEQFLTPEEKRKLQRSELEILKELDRIAKEHGLRYFLTAGTLLGAIRHEGFIPWDDDIDVVMPTKDYKKLSKIAGEVLEEGYFFQDERSDKGYPFAFAKIRKNGSEVYEPILKDFEIHKGEYIDIFPLESCPVSDGRAGRFFKAVEILNCAIIARVKKDFICCYEKKYMRATFSLLRHLPTGLLRAMRRAVIGYYRIFTTGKKLATVSGSHGYPRESYDAKWFDKAVKVSFEGGEYPAPRGHHELLTNMYGDYKTPPPERERAGHFRKKDN